MVREGSRRFEGVEPLGNSVQVPYTPCYHCEDEVREGSVQSNHSELMSKTFTHLAFSELKWFEKVRGGSRGLNHSVIVYRYPTQLVNPRRACARVTVVNPRRACAARVTVVVLCVCVCVCVCVFVCPGRSSATHVTKRQTRYTHGFSILLAPE